MQNTEAKLQYPDNHSMINKSHLSSHCELGSFLSVGAAQRLRDSADGVGLRSRPHLDHRDLSLGLRAVRKYQIKAKIVICKSSKATMTMR